ncbi:MAG: multidrug effflux MFS transporter [Spirochaetales bacterium]|nr:multidrug effflux MFS transporter [Spirochaetales bacterium]
MGNKINKNVGILRISIIGAGLMALAPLSTDMYLSSFTIIAEDMATMPSFVQLSLSIFLAGLSITQLIYGPIADRFGRKKPLLIGLLMFVVATLVCITTSNITVFIVARFFQALGAASGMVISQVLGPDLYDNDKKKLGLFFTILSFVMGIAPIVAPTIGGFILAAAGWRTIFIALLAFSILMILTVIVLIPETKGANPAIKLSKSLSSYKAVVKKPGFISVSFTRSLANAGMFFYITSAPIIFMQYYKLSSMTFGLVFGINAVAILIGSALNGILLKKFGPEKLFMISTILISFFSILLIIVGFMPKNMMFFMVPLFGYLLSLGGILPGAATLALHGHGENSGSASSLLGCITFAFSFAASTFVSFIPNSIPVITKCIAASGLIASIIFFSNRQKITQE